MSTKNEAMLDLVRGNFCLACGRANYIEIKTGSPRVEVHHVEERQKGGAHGGDDWWNLIPLCTECHTAAPYSWHANFREFLRKFPHVRSYLLLFGWEFLELGHKLKIIHPAYAQCKPKSQPVWAIPWDTIVKILKPKNIQGRINEK